MTVGRLSRNTLPNALWLSCSGRESRDPSRPSGAVWVDVLPFVSSQCRQQSGATQGVSYGNCDFPPPAAAAAASKPNGAKPAAAASKPAAYSKADAAELRGLILAAVSKGDMSIEQASAELAQLVEVRSAGPLRCKVSEKHAVSVYGLQRMPVTLYAEQWERLFSVAEDIKTFIEEHASELNRKHSK